MRRVALATALVFGASRQKTGIPNRDRLRQAAHHDASVIGLFLRREQSAPVVLRRRVYPMLCLMTSIPKAYLSREARRRAPLWSCTIRSWICVQPVPFEAGWAGWRATFEAHGGSRRKTASASCPSSELSSLPWRARSSSIAVRLHLSSSTVSKYPCARVRGTRAMWSLRSVRRETTPTGTWTFWIESCPSEGSGPKKTRSVLSRTTQSKRAAFPIFLSRCS